MESSEEFHSYCGRVNFENIFILYGTNVTLVLIPIFRKNIKTIYKDPKDHKCDYCEKYYQCSILKTQIKIVNDGNKDYKYEHCGKYFLLNLIK